MDTLRVGPNNWESIVDKVREHTDNNKIPIWSAVANYYNLCVPSVITELSVKVWNLHQRISGTKNETYSSYYDLPAFWVDACAIIDGEIARIDKIRQDKASRKQDELMRRLGRKKNGNK